VGKQDEYVIDIENTPRLNTTLAWREAALRAALPSLPLLAGLFAFALASIRGGNLLNDPDTYLHITAGKWMAAHGMLPASDPFSHSMPGALWIVHEWLSELVLGATFTAFGWHGIILLTAACFGVSLAVIARRLLDHGDAMTSLVLAVCAGLLLELHLLARPHILALPVMVIWCGALVAARDRKETPSLALLPLMTLWSNLHGSFMVGLGLSLFLGAEAALERGASWRAELKGWSIFTALAGAAALLNPNGIQSFLLPVRFMGMTVLHDSFNEWQSVNFHALQPLELWLLGMLLVGYGLGLKLPLWRLLFVVGLTHLALQAARHGDLLAVLAPLLAWPSLGPQVRARMEAGGRSAIARSFAALAPPARWPALVTTMALAVAIAGGELAKPAEPGDRPATPISAVAAAKAMGLSGPVFNDEGFGGYLIFEGIPTFIDGRIEMYGGSFLADYLKAAQGDEAALTAIFDRYHIAWTILQPRTGAALILKRLPGWQRVYSDETAVIDLRIAPALGDAAAGR
jgi:uncharacterized membrane protein YhaH (DUF805 family)